jgi:outer membrane lipopolysaccharide assembly protein LptE/RlpB
MAELTDTHPADTTDAAHIERELRARVAELEALVEARTQTIVGMGARLAELTGDAPPSLMERARAAETELALLASTKVLRYSRLPRRVYTSLRRRLRG